MSTTEDSQSTMESSTTESAPLNPPPAAPEAATAKGTPAESLIDIDHFAQVQLKTAVIAAAERVEKSKKLVKLQVEVGEEKRQIVAGIAAHYEPEQLIGRKIVIVANLKPAKLMGIESQGMLLAASTEDGLLSLVTAGEEIPSGARVR